jgi:predicted 3-demethylubiquinone-9 3-methyltransferase (glyoxalase superfamily)
MKLGGSPGNVHFLISLSYCEYFPSSAITNIHLYYMNEKDDSIGRVSQNRYRLIKISVYFGLLDHL